MCYYVPRELVMSNAYKLIFLLINEYPHMVVPHMRILLITTLPPQCELSLVIIMK